MPSTDGDHRQPADDQPAAGLGARRPAQQPQRGEEQDDRQHHDQRADDPADALGHARTDRADAVAPRGRAEHDRQAQHGQADAVPAVLGGQRLGLLRAGDRAGEAAGAAGEQVPAPPATIPKRPGDFFFLAAGRRLAVERFAGGRFLLAAVEPERPREDAGRRVDVVRAGMRRTVIAFGARIRQAGGSCPAPTVRGPNVTDMTSVSPTGSWPTPITSELVVRAAARLGEVGRRRRRRLVVGVTAQPRAAGR